MKCRLSQKRRSCASMCDHWDCLSKLVYMKLFVWFSRLPPVEFARNVFGGKCERLTMGKTAKTKGGHPTKYRDLSNKHVLSFHARLKGSELVYYANLCMIQPNDFESIRFKKVSIWNKCQVSGS